MPCWDRQRELDRPRIEIEHRKDFAGTAASSDQQSVLAGEGCNFGALLIQLRERGNFTTHPQKFTVEVQEHSVPALVSQFPIQLRAAKCLLTLRVGNLSTPAKSRKFLGTSLAHSFHQCRIAVADKILKWRNFAVFFAHKEQWNVGSQKYGAGGELQLLERRSLSQAVTEQTVADLVMILGKDD